MKLCQLSSRLGIISSALLLIFSPLHSALVKSPSLDKNFLSSKEIRPKVSSLIKSLKQGDGLRICMFVMGEPGLAREIADAQRTNRFDYSFLFDQSTQKYPSGREALAIFNTKRIRYGLVNLGKEKILHTKLIAIKRADGTYEGLAGSANTTQQGMPSSGKRGNNEHMRYLKGKPAEQLYEVARNMRAFLHNGSNSIRPRGSAKIYTVHNPTPPDNLPLLLPPKKEMVTSSLSYDLMQGFSDAMRAAHKSIIIIDGYDMRGSPLRATRAAQENGNDVHLLINRHGISGEDGSPTKSPLKHLNAIVDNGGEVLVASGVDHSKMALVEPQSPSKSRSWALEGSGNFTPTTDNGSFNQIWVKRLTGSPASEATAASHKKRFEDAREKATGLRLFLKNRSARTKLKF